MVGPAGLPAAFVGIARLVSAGSQAQEARHDTEQATGRLEHAPAVSLSQENVGDGPSIQAYNYIEVRSDFVWRVRVSDAALAACADGRFVPPRKLGQLEQAQNRLATTGVVVLAAPLGSGRRTLAHRLLRGLASDRPRPLFDLQPQWLKPAAHYLPTAPGDGYIFDFATVPTDDRTMQFSSDLLTWAADGHASDRFVVVLVLDHDLNQDWAAPFRADAISVLSPDARQLVQGELLNRGRDDLIPQLDDQRFGAIWTSNPRARDSVVLAGILARTGSGGDIADALDEFGGWHAHIDHLLNPEAQGAVDPTTLSTRTLVWSAALLNGGSRRSVLSAADDLLRRLDRTPGPADILGGPTSAKRLAAAELVMEEDRVRHRSDKHNLPIAILLNLWDDFSTVEDRIVKWAVDVAADPKLTDEDAGIAARALVRLAEQLGDGRLISLLGSALARTRRSLAVDVLTDAALDPRVGPLVRSQLYSWSKSSSADLRQLVAGLCSGRFGGEMPGQALTRLRWAAGSPADQLPEVVNAIRCLAVEQPTLVREALATWISDRTARMETLSFLLGLAASEEGARQLIEWSRDPTGRTALVAAWQELMTDERAEAVVARVLDQWEGLASSGLLPEHGTLDLLADVFRPEITRNQRFFADGPDFLESFRGKVMFEAITRNRQTREANNALAEPLESPNQL
jgi:hypothetical protein